MIVILHACNKASPFTEDVSWTVIDALTGWLIMYSGKLLREKTLPFFAVSEPSAKVFSAKFVGGEIHVGRNAHVACMWVRCACARATLT